jgi:hypothetical protein
MAGTGDRGPRGEGSAGRRNAPIEAQSVRQGRRGTRVTYVMAASLALVILALLALWAAVLGPHAGRVGRTTGADADQFHQGVPTAKAAPARSPAGADAH